MTEMHTRKMSSAIDALCVCPPDDRLRSVENFAFAMAQNRRKLLYLNIPWL